VLFRSKVVVAMMKLVIPILKELNLKVVVAMMELVIPILKERNLKKNGFPLRL
jgi:hypothetical protein